MAFRWRPNSTSGDRKSTRPCVLSGHAGATDFKSAPEPGHPRQPANLEILPRHPRWHSGGVRIRPPEIGRAHVLAFFRLTLVQPTSNPRLNQVILASLRTWKFFPATRDGIPVASEFDLRRSEEHTSLRSFGSRWCNRLQIRA